MAADLNPNQTNFFIQHSTLDTAPPQFAEICTAIYERELVALSMALPADPLRIKQKLRGLTHHVKRAAFFMAHPHPVLHLDSHNGSWYSKPAGRCPAHKVTAEQTSSWLTRYATYGMAVPVLVEQLEGTTVELDSIDRVDMDNQRVHTNKYRWFSLAGDPQTNGDSVYRCRLVRPAKAVMQAACCGHRWSHHGKLPPRPLSLRELLLSTTLDWRNFRQPLRPISR